MVNEEVWRAKSVGAVCDWILIVNLLMMWISDTLQDSDKAVGNFLIKLVKRPHLISLLGIAMEFYWSAFDWFVGN